MCLVSGSVARCWFKKPPNVLKRQAPNQPKYVQTSPNYSPKFAMKLAVCGESNHHYLITVAVFVQRTIDLSYKATWNLQINNIKSHRNVTAIKLSLIMPPHIAVEIKCKQQTLVHTTVYQARASRNKEKKLLVFFIFCNFQRQLQFVKLRENMFDLIFCVVILMWCRLTFFIY